MQFYENYLYMVDLAWSPDLKPKQDPARGKLFPKKIKQGLKFEDVWFKYPSQTTGFLKVLTFLVAATENIVIGENGAGKTTLVKLLAGLISF